MNAPSKARNTEPPNALPIMALVGALGPTVSLLYGDKEAVGLSVVVMAEVSVLTLEGIGGILREQGDG
jgi:hypothetical protein